jgi:HEAT repeat protein
MPMNQLLSWLAGTDLRTNGPANEVADFVLANPDAFEDLFAGLFERDDVVRGRTADALEKVTRSRPDLIRVHLPEMSSLAQEEQVPVVKMHLAMIFGHLAVYPGLVEQLMEVLLFQLKDESVFTRGWAIGSLCIIGRKYTEECRTVLDHLAPLQRDNSIAVRSRVKKAINLLTVPGSQFPKGWIKSEHLQGI